MHQTSNVTIYGLFYFQNIRTSVFLSQVMLCGQVLHRVEGRDKLKAPAGFCHRVPVHTGYAAPTASPAWAWAHTKSNLASHHRSANQCWTDFRRKGQACVPQSCTAPAQTDPSVHSGAGLEQTAKKCWAEIQSLDPSLFFQSILLRILW